MLHQKYNQQILFPESSRQIKFAFYKKLSSSVLRQQTIKMHFEK